MPDLTEAVLVSLWLSRAFSDRLATTDGRDVAVIETGDVNLDGGPDIRDALVRIGGTLYRGDVELHLDARSWSTHGHHRDAHYNSVILHVATGAPSHVARSASGRIVPLVIVTVPRAFASSQHPPSTFQATVPPCRGSMPDRSPASIRRWLNRLKRERLTVKVVRLEDRLRELALERNNLLHEPSVPFCHSGGIPSPLLSLTNADLRDRSLWDQLLYEGIMEGLGYAKNRHPMRSLARALPLRILRKHRFESRETMEALLFASSGLLPEPGTLVDEESAAYALQLHRQWQEIRQHEYIPALHPAEWLFFRLRPVNFPTARLAIMAAIVPAVFGETGFWGVVGMIRAGALSGSHLYPAFEKLLRVQVSVYWQNRFLFGPATGTCGAALGKGRILEILVNTVVPLLLLYASVMQERPVRRAALALYAALPRGEENGITLRMQDALGHGRFPFDGAGDQQALLQWFAAYCRTGRCSDCGRG
jgi:hypothetical protein